LQILDQPRLALEAAGVEFIDENGGGPGVRSSESKRMGGGPDQLSGHDETIDWCVYPVLTMSTLGFPPCFPEGVMSIFWHLEHELIRHRVEYLEKKIAWQRQSLKRFPADSAKAKTVLGMLQVREQSLQRAKIYEAFIESKLTFVFPGSLAAAPIAPHLVERV
jgi:hypothetical protein